MEEQIPEYPTHQQIEECFAAYKKDGQKGILEFLKKQRAERERVVGISGATEAKPWRGESMEKS